MKVTIGMSLHDKNEALNNVLLSITKQKTNYDYNLCFLDDASEIDPVPIIETYFNKEQYILRRFDNPIGFVNIRAKLNEIVPKSTEVLIFQSADVIWGNSNLLNNLVEPILDNNRGKVNKEIITIPSEVKNYDIDPNLYKSKNFYDDLMLATLPTNVSTRGHDKKPEYLFLGAIHIDTFRSVLGLQKWNSPAVCDIIMQDAIETFNMPFVPVGGCAVHQRHVNLVHECGSINVCTNPCAPRRRMIKGGIRFPHKIGWYNYATKKWGPTKS